MAKIYTISILILLLSIDVFLFFGQTAIAQINPGANISLQDYNSSLISDYDQGDNVLVARNDTSVLPLQTKSVTETQETIFSDPLTVIKNWFLDSLGGKYLISLLGGPTSYLALWGLPKAFVFGVGAFWYGITIFLIISFIVGRD